MPKDRPPLEIVAEFLEGLAQGIAERSLEASGGLQAGEPLQWVSIGYRAVAGEPERFLTIQPEIRAGRAVLTVSEMPHPSSIDGAIEAKAALAWHRAQVETLLSP